MRALFAAATMLIVGLAGCADEEPLPAQEPVLPVIVEGLGASHPAYGYLTNEALPHGDGSAFFEDTDAGRIWFKPPMRPLPDALNTMEPLAQSPQAEATGGISVFGSFAYYGGRGSGPLHILDIRDPAAPELISSTPDVPVRDADIIAYPDGRLVLISTSGSASVVATDVTDPTQARLIGVFDTPGSGHNIAVVPGTPIVYNSGMDIIDFTDPTNPIDHGTWGGDGCHDIAFYISPEKQRAYCAGYANSEIWDIADPLAPELIIEIPFPGVVESLPGAVGNTAHQTGADETLGSICTPGTPATGPVCPVGHPGFSHLAIVNHDATLLIVGDETGGGAANACDFYADAGEAGTLSGPIGNLYFYDITDETDPIFGGHVSPSFLDAFDPDSPTDSCTAHFGKIIEDTGFLVMGFYGAGVALVDFRDIYNPVIVDLLDQGGSIWDVWYHAGRLYTGDMERGLDVIDLA